MWKQVLLATLASASLQSAGAATLLSYDFNGPNPWPDVATDVLPSTPLPVTPEIDQKPVGTVDVANSTERTGGMLLSTDVGAATGPWEVTFVSGPLAVKNSEANLAKLTLAFDLSVSTVRPVTVRFESFNAAHARTGQLEATVLPAAPDFYQRSAIDLSTMKPVGNGKFNPTDPFVQIVFVITGPDWPSNMKHELRLDNLHYASAAWYVSPKGKDTNDGRTEATPLADPQKAVDQAQAGDIILMMGGTYHRPKNTSSETGIISFRRPGTPAAWISVKNYPGQEPILNSDGWNTIKMGRGTSAAPSTEPALAYLEMRGLHLLGNAYTVKQEFPDSIGKAEAVSNSNGISCDARLETNVPHHLRIADNIVEQCCGGGISDLFADWVTVENNTVLNNCWFMIYAGSGISMLGTNNFDAQVNVYKDLVRNNRVFGNRCYMPWGKIKKMSDGNGIIVDSNHLPTEGKSYLGRTLITNNLVVANGGSGIHSFRSHYIDVINNTAYMNAATSALSWGQVFAQSTADMTFYNNIVVARPKQPLNTVSYDYRDRGNTKIVRENNVYVSGGTDYVKGQNDLFADPEFVNASLDPKTADFRLKAGSRAIGFGVWQAFSPLNDLAGNPRPIGGPVDAGAYQTATTPKAN